MSDTIKGVKIKELPEKDTMADTDILVVEDSEATKQISAEAMKTYFTADLVDEIQKLKDENAELSDNLYKSVEFYNGDEWLETVVVMRGDDAVYTGDTPINTDNPNASFSGWKPEPSNVKENLKCYAQYNSIGAFAFYSENNSSFNFYYGEVPKEGTTYDDKVITNIYMGFDNDIYNSDSNVPWHNNVTDITVVNFNESFAEVRPVSTAYWFKGFSNCIEINGLNYLNTSLVTNMNGMFNSCDNLIALDVSEFDTSLVTNMSNMFSGCYELTTLDVSKFDTSLVTDMSAMFSDCRSLTDLDVSKFNTSSVTTMTSMFWRCSSLTSLDVSKFNTSSVTTLFNMFASCSELTILDVSKFSTGLVTNMMQMFSGCTNLTTLNMSGFDTSSVTTMQNMFNSCGKLTVLDVSNFDTNSVINMGGMFNYCSHLSTIYSNDTLFTTEKVTSSGNMFLGCTNLVGGNGTTYDAYKTDGSMAHIDTADNPGYFTAK